MERATPILDFVSLGIFVTVVIGFVYLIINRFKMRISISDILLYILVFVFVGGFWFILQILSGNFEILYDFFVYQWNLPLFLMK